MVGWWGHINCITITPHTCKTCASTNLYSTPNGVKLVFFGHKSEWTAFRKSTNLCYYAQIWAFLAALRCFYRFYVPIFHIEPKQKLNASFGAQFGAHNELLNVEIFEKLVVASCRDGFFDVNIVFLSSMFHKKDSIGELFRVHEGLWHFIYWWDLITVPS